MMAVPVSVFVISQSSIIETMAHSGIKEWLCDDKKSTLIKYNVSDNGLFICRRTRCTN
jgi:hypothetical protein